MTLYQMKEQLAQVGAELKTQRDWITANAANPTIKIEAIREAKTKRDELQERFDEIKAEHDRIETAQREEMERRAAEAERDNSARTAKDDVTRARATFYRAALMKRPIPENVQTLLGAIPADATVGDGQHLLPINMSNELITEPFETNPMRGIERVSQITNLIRPKLDFELEDDDFIDDTEVAKELAMDAGQVVFGRFKFKVKAAVSDTVYHGTDTDLVGTIDNGLRSALAAKEKKVMFATAPIAAEAHMSFYSTTNGIAKSYGATMLDAILNAIADLPDMFAENAAVVMRRSDYIHMIRDLANTNDTLWGKKPEDVIGYPVHFVDRAVMPVVGDFRFAQLNYDGQATYDTDKDVDQGVYKFVLTAWADHRLLLKSAFRVAEVGIDPNPAQSEPVITNVLTVAALPITGIADNTIYVLTEADGERPAGSMWFNTADGWAQFE